MFIAQNFELKQLKKGGTWTEEVNTKEINWYPLQKVNFARRKLEGANPAAITRYITHHDMADIGLFQLEQTPFPDEVFDAVITKPKC